MPPISSRIQTLEPMQHRSCERRIPESASPWHNGWREALPESGSVVLVLECLIICGCRLGRAPCLGFDHRVSYR